MSQPDSLLLKIEPQAWNEFLFKPQTDHQSRQLAKFLDFRYFSFIC